MVKYLLKNYVEKDQTDLLGLSALDYAKHGGFKDIIELLGPESESKSFVKEE